MGKFTSKELGADHGESLTIKGLFQYKGHKFLIADIGGIGQSGIDQTKEDGEFELWRRYFKC